MAQCVSCQQSLRKLRRYDFKSRVFRDIYTGEHVYRCTGCGLDQVDVDLVDDARLTAYYRDDYRAVAGIGVARIPSQHAWYALRGKAIAAIALHQTPDARRAFELGAGYGYNLEALQAVFPNADLYTDEVDAELQHYRRAQLDQGPWDLVILSHVVEHFSDPARLVQTAVDQLSPNGCVIIEVPNDREGIVPINGPDEPHLIFFEKRTLAQLVQRLHCNIVDLYTAGPRNQQRTRGRWIKATLRSLARELVLHTPLRAHLLRRQARNVSSQDFSAQREDGIFLRAVLRRAEN